MPSGSTRGIMLKAWLQNAPPPTSGDRRRRRDMPVYTGHEPPCDGRVGAPESDPARMAFVRDGFTFWAFLLGPLWMLWHRLWLVLIGYLVLAGSLQFALARLGATGTARTLVGLLIAILVGLEAASLRRWTLNRRRWNEVGVVVADDANMAERRFFDAWVNGAASGGPARPAPFSQAVPPRTAAHAPGATSNDVIGLFPQPGGRAGPVPSSTTGPAPCPRPPRRSSAPRARAGMSSPSW